jgi:hypothetical protein
MENEMETTYVEKYDTVPYQFKHTFDNNEKKKIETVSGLKELIFRLIEDNIQSKSHCTDGFRSPPREYFKLGFVRTKGNSAAFTLPHNGHRYCEGEQNVIIGAISEGKFGYSVPIMYYEDRDRIGSINYPLFTVRGIRDLTIQPNLALVDLFTDISGNLTRIEIDLNNTENQIRGFNKAKEKAEDIESEVRRYRAKRTFERMIE